jgi:hypothetical protein
MADTPSAAAIQQEIERRFGYCKWLRPTCPERKPDVVHWCDACLLRASPSGLEALVAKWRERQKLNEVNSEYDYDDASTLCARLSGRAEAQKECADELESALRAPAARSGGE